MKKKIYLFLLAALFINAVSATPKISLSTPTIAAGNFNQGTSNNIVYAIKMKVTSGPVSVSSIKFKLSGTFDANDIDNVSIFFNSTAVSISGASYYGGATGTFAAPHTYTISIGKSFAATDSGYFIIAVNLNATATDNHTVNIKGDTDPVSFTYSVSSTVTNSQSNKAGIKTIQAADISLSSATIAAGNFNQGTNNNILYAVKIKAKTEPVTVNNIQFTLTGSIDANDIDNISIYFNSTAVSISGASYYGGTAGTFAAPHTYSISIGKPLAINDLGYFIIALNTNATATDNHTVHIKGDSNPVVFGFTTAPNIFNYQADKDGIQTIQAADISLSSATIAAGNFNQGTNNNILYAVKIKAKTEPVTVNNIQFTLTGSIDANDINNISIYFNSTAVSISGASYYGGAAGTFAAPHTYSISIGKPLAINDSGYFIIALNTNATATDNHTVHIKGDTNPVVFGFTTAPNIFNYQADKGAIQTIQAADISLSSATIAAGNFNQGTNNNILYAVKIKAKTEPVTVNNIQFTLTGSIDANDIDNISIYFNSTAVSISGASYYGGAAGTFAAPHTYSISIGKPLAINDSGYFIIALNTNATATDNHTVHIKGDTNPVVFGFTTAPNIFNYQADKGAIQTIQAADITLSSSSLPSGSILQGSNNNIIYAVKMQDATEPVTVNNIQFTLTGSIDANDINNISIYFNPTAVSISGASYYGGAAGTFAAPHTYSISIGKPLAAGDQGYFIIAVNVNSSGTTGHTVKIDGSANPVVFGYTTHPNVTNNQTNSAGTKTIAASLNKPAGTDESIFAVNSNSFITNLYPNPANTSFSFSFNGTKNEKISAQLKDRSGNILLIKSLYINKGANIVSMNVSKLTSGIYYLSVTGEQGSLPVQKQVIIQH